MRVEVTNESLPRLSHVPLPTLPIIEPLRSLFPEEALVCGRTVLCSGDAALSLALRVVAAATQAGSWLGVVGVAHFGLMSACEQGVALQRMVLVTPTANKREWASTVAAVADGFELIMLQVPHGVGIADAQRVQARIQSRRNVLVLIDTARKPASQSVFQPDVVLHTSTTRWHGIEQGAGYVQGREVAIAVSGRRVPKAVQRTVHHVG
jgi:hypothetical protein